MVIDMKKNVCFKIVYVQEPNKNKLSFMFEILSLFIVRLVFVLFLPAIVYLLEIF